MAYSARVLQICDDAQTLFKDRGGGEFEDATLVLFINDCLNELERRGAFKKLSYFDGTVDVNTYDLNSEVSDLVAPISVGWKASSSTHYRQLEVLQSIQQYLNCKETQDSYTAVEVATTYYSPTYAVFEGTNMYVWPAPTETVTNGFELWHKYTVTRITDDINPPTPEAWDIMYTLWCVYMGFLGDVPSRNSPDQARQWLMRAEQKIGDYLETLRPQRIVMRVDRP